MNSSAAAVAAIPHAARQRHDDSTCFVTTNRLYSEAHSLAWRAGGLSLRRLLLLRPSEHRLSVCSGGGGSGGGARARARKTPTTTR